MDKREKDYHNQKITFNSKDSGKIRTSMETAMITIIGETIEEHFDGLDFIEVVSTSEEIFNRLSKFMEFNPVIKKMNEGIMGERYGKCSICGVQIPLNSTEELHYDLEEDSNPAYCKKCWDMKEKDSGKTEEHNETPWYKPHKFKRSGYYKVE